MQAVSIPFIHAFMMKALDRAGNTALNSQAAAQLRAERGLGEGNLHSYQGKKEPAFRREAFDSESPTCVCEIVESD